MCTSLVHVADIGNSKLNRVFSEGRLKEDNLPSVPTLYSLFNSIITLAVRTRIAFSFMNSL